MKCKTTVTLTKADLLVIAKSKVMAPEDAVQTTLVQTGSGGWVPSANEAVQVILEWESPA
jgi:hypothetical protein